MKKNETQWTEFFFTRQDDFLRAGKLKIVQSTWNCKDTNSL